MVSPTVSGCVAVLDGLYDPALAEDWDAVGLSVGDPGAVVERVLFAVDPTPEVAAEAVGLGAALLVTHHPLFLRGVHGVAETTPGGRVVATLVRGGCALVSAHTNADVARPGVSDALAAALGLGETEPLAPADARLDTLAVFVPTDGTARLLDALAAAGAGRLGDYDRCGWWTSGTGTFRPGPHAHPAVGERGRVEQLAEDRLEMVVPRGRRAAVLAALRTAHPYEEPAWSLVETAVPSRQGLGRVGDLPAPLPLADFVARVAAALPATAAGVRSTGDPQRPVRRVAVCGGSGGELAGAAAAAGADVLVTADGRHHHTLDAVAEHGVAAVDVAHWASEWPWLPAAAARLVAALEGQGHTVATAVSTRVTDPWTLHTPSPRTATPPD